MKNRLSAIGKILVVGRALRKIQRSPDRVLDAAWEKHTARHLDCVATTGCKATIETIS